MGNYEALQKAEQERRQKISGNEAAPVQALDWDMTPQTAPLRTPEKKGILRRVFSRKSKKVEALSSQEANELNKRRIAILRPESYIAEQFRTLRGRLEAISDQTPIATVGVTSANAGEGKSTAAVNLAVVTAMGVDTKVIVVDCDLRRPTIHKTLGVTPETGLTELLLGQVSLDEAVVKVEGTSLEAILVRQQPDNPSELLASAQMERLIEELVSRYDRVILDTPACLGLPDAKIVSDLCDGIVVVVRANKTPREEVNAVLEILDRRKILGMVLNDADAERESYGYY